jgi:hypothetical protein
MMPVSCLSACSALPVNLAVVSGEISAENYPLRLNGKKQLKVIL